MYATIKKIPRKFSLNALEHCERTSLALIDLSEDDSARVAGSPNGKRPWQLPGLAAPRKLHTVDEVCE